MSEMKPPMFDRVVTHERAREAAHRLVNSHFRQEPRARASIPANEDDDDLVITDYITQQIAAARELRATQEALIKANGEIDLRNRTWASPELFEIVKQDAENAARELAERNSAIRSVADSFRIPNAYADPPPTVSDLLVAIAAKARELEDARAALRDAMKLLPRADGELFHGTNDTREDWLNDYKQFQIDHADVVGRHGRVLPKYPDAGGEG